MNAPAAARAPEPATAPPSARPSNEARRGLSRIRATVTREAAKLYRPMPWRHIDNPYAVLVSEVMLQQTQVARVLEKYPIFLEHFPTIRALAEASTAAVVRAWQGLGYNRRALFLQRAAQRIVAEHNGVVPQNSRELHALPGVGRATAGAVMVYGYGIPTVFIETNIRRVFIFYCFGGETRDESTAHDSGTAPVAATATIATPVALASAAALASATAAASTAPAAAPISDAQIEPLIQAIMPTRNCRAWYYALTDLGASLAARAGYNPNTKSRGYHRQSAFEGSPRQLRGAIIRHLSATGTLHTEELPQLCKRQESDVAVALQSLEHDGFIIVSEKGAVYLTDTEKQGRGA